MLGLATSNIHGDIGNEAHVKGAAPGEPEASKNGGGCGSRHWKDLPSVPGGAAACNPGLFKADLHKLGGELLLAEPPICCRNRTGDETVAAAAALAVAAATALRQPLAAATCRLRWDSS